ncbi:MAG: aspartate carbamoyltransferase regulatory subunit [Thermoproteota archaeon]|jgi:aspartate carbamoyltransferase regulatory subunit|nr:aspartate carbamoyltransferase regulatory subunit [Thermoproteota archaeon]
MTEEIEMKVTKIRNGTVIDHIPNGRALSVLKLLGLTGKEGLTIALVMNVKSKKIGIKDVVKVENLELEPSLVSRLALIAPTATINIIRDYKVYEKRKIILQDVIENILKCTNPTCISRQPNEPIVSKFKVISKNPLKLQCMYCNRYLSENEVISQITEGGG